MTGVSLVPRLTPLFLYYRSGGKKSGVSLGTRLDWGKPGNEARLG